MALIEVDTPNGPRKVRVCNYCRRVCIPSGSYCSGRCYRSHMEEINRAAERLGETLRGMDNGKDGAK